MEAIQGEVFMLGSNTTRSRLTVFFREAAGGQKAFQQGFRRRNNRGVFLFTGDQRFHIFGKLFECVWAVVLICEITHNIPSFFCPCC